MRFNKYPDIIRSLRIVVSALESQNTIHNPNYPQTSNMGLVAQALLGINETDLKEQFTNAYFPIGRYSGKRTWWAEWTREYWAMNSSPRKTILRKLEAVGLERDDLADIDYLNNPIINKLFDEKVPMGTTSTDVYEIRTREVPKKIYKTIEWKEEHYRTDWWGRLWGFKHTVIRTEQIEDDIEMVEEKYKVKTGVQVTPITKNPNNVDHVIAYFKIWADYLEEEYNKVTKEVKNADNHK